MTAASLKGYIPALARILGTTPAALYERQRALVAADMLDVSEGRGPGSGVRATAPAIGMLLVAMLAPDGLSETAARVRVVCAARPVGRERCPLTRTKSFLDALATILATTGKAASVQAITVSRTSAQASLRYYDNDGVTRVAEFAGSPRTDPSISVSATLHHGALAEISKDVQSVIGETFEERDAKRS